MYSLTEELYGSLAVPGQGLSSHYSALGADWNNRLQWSGLPPRTKSAAWCCFQTDASSLYSLDHSIRRRS
ncbi:hypothetical protein WMW72_24815 [Paenibacillus filicis]|uniref:Uncharacterized protein n=1 Tax=Paenibacillus filicis TaxID=669464 RepID=A0ABU9DSC8_9BACL